MYSPDPLPFQFTLTNVSDGEPKEKFNLLKVPKYAIHVNNVPQPQMSFELVKDSTKGIVESTVHVYIYLSFECGFSEHPQTDISGVLDPGLLEVRHDGRQSGEPHPHSLTAPHTRKLVSGDV